MAVGSDQESADGRGETAHSSPALISLNILAVIRDAQQQHGLRHADYQRYRGYCSRRLRRLRKVLKLQQGDRRHYRRRDVTAAHLAGAGAARSLCVPLLQAERAWAHAMQLRQEANTEPRKRFHLVQRLRKATAHSLALLALAESGECSARTQLEAQAYSASVAGALLLELRRWDGAREQLARAQHVYSQLAAALPVDESRLYTDKVEELQPSLRYCAYNAGDESAAAELRDLRARGLLHNIDELMAQAKEAAAGAAREVVWRGRSIAVRAERARVLLATLADLDGALEAAPDAAARLALLEHALVDCKEAAQAARDDQRAGGDQWLLVYLTHLRLTLTVRRNDLLVSEAERKQARPRDLVRLYEIILHNYAELRALPGLADDAEYQAELADHALAYRALRAFRIAHVLLALRRSREALAMLDRSAALARQALAARELPVHLRAALRDLETRAESSRCEVHADSVLEAGEAGEPASGRGARPRLPAAERPDELADEPLAPGRAAACRLPPAMRPIACKPLFFDLACNLLEMPSAGGVGVAPTGLGGLVRGLLGWGSRK